MNKIILVLAITIFAFLQAQAEVENLRIIPQENYGVEALDLLQRKGEMGVDILQFNFFTDNPGETIPKQIVQKLIEIKKSHPKTEINVALEDRKDLHQADGKGIAQRNAKTSAFLQKHKIAVSGVHGQTEFAVSHTKLLLVGDEVIAGSTNMTKQSTDPGANNEMNLGMTSAKISQALHEYVQEVIAAPEEMHNHKVVDGPVLLLTDQLYFDELLKQIEVTKKGDQLGMSMYQFLYRSEADQQPKQIFDALIAAHQRGVQIEIFLNRAKDPKIQNTEANYKVADALIKAGITQIYFDPEEKISHSKYMYRLSPTESVALISSSNIYRVDFNDNHQLSWVITENPATDTSVTQSLVNYFKQQVARDGTLRNSSGGF